jgi:hypothetical protein
LKRPNGRKATGHGRYPLSEGRSSVAAKGKKIVICYGREDASDIAEHINGWLVHATSHERTGSI